MRPRASAKCAASLVVLLSTGAAVGDNLIGNSGFDAGAAGWLNQGAGSDRVVSEHVAVGGRSGGGLHIRFDEHDDQAMWIWRYVINDPPKRQRLRIRGWAKGQSVSKVAAVCVQAWNADRSDMVGFATTQTTQPLSGDFEWTQIETTIDPSPQTRQIHVLAFLNGKGEVWFDDVTVETDGPATAAAAPGLFRIRGEYKVTVTPGSIIAGFLKQMLEKNAQRKNDEGPRFVFPLPLCYREQAPLTYALEVDPPDRLARVKVMEDRPENFVAEVALTPMRPGDTVLVRWSSIVLCGPRSFDDVPAEAPLPETWPEETRRWLAGTACVQADHERIVAVAKEIRGESTDVLTIIHATTKRMKTIFESYAGQCTSLDAVQALDRQGSCTSAANLCAALLRANGIPARILAGYPVWSGPLQTHYIVEAYVPRYGWYPIETSLLRAPWPPYQQIEVAIIPPEYEDRSEKRAGVAGGVPYLSLTERVGSDDSYMIWGMVDEKRFCDHVAEPWRNLDDQAPAEEWNSALEAARAAWRSWITSAELREGAEGMATSLRPDRLEGVGTLEELAKRMARAADQEAPGGDD